MGNVLNFTPRASLDRPAFCPSHLLDTSETSNEWVRQHTEWDLFIAAFSAHHAIKMFVYIFHTLTCICVCTAAQQTSAGDKSTHYTRRAPRVERSFCAALWYKIIYYLRLCECATESAHGSYARLFILYAFCPNAASLKLFRSRIKLAREMPHWEADGI